MADDNRARQLQIVIGAVEEGMLDSFTALRAVSQWLSSSAAGLCDVLLDQPELTDASKQSLRARFEEVALDGHNTQLAESHGQTIDDSGIRRLRVFLEEPDEPSPNVPDDADDKALALAASTVEFNRAAAGARQDDTATQAYVPLAKPAASRARLNFVLEHFQVIREFARGGLGILYLAEDKRLQRQVILKKIRAEHAASSLAREKFVLEAEVTGQLEHPGIVPIYALGTDGKREPYYAMRLIEGKNLHATIKELHGQRSAGERFFDGLRVRELLQRFIDVCHALHYAHSRGIIHRDLKPANIMLGEHGETLVIDWGLAKALSNIEQEDIVDVDNALVKFAPIRLSGDIDPSIEGEFAGTARYAPPEQLAGQLQQLCPASDIYSLGAILVEILCNQPALGGTLDSAKMALIRIKEGQLRAPREVLLDVPRPLNAICIKAMSVNIPDRYASAQELAEDVQRWLADECVLAYRTQETQWERVGRWFRHHRSWAAGIALSLVALSVSALLANYFINQARLNEKIAKRQAIEFKDDAVARYRIAKSAVDTLMERSDKLLDIAGTQAIRAQLLQEAATKYSELSQTESLDADLEIERARAMVRLADALALQGQSQAAFDQYDQVIRMLTPDPASSESIEDLSDIELQRYIELGRSYTRRAQAFWQEGKIDQARNDFNRAIELLKDLQTRHADLHLLAGNLAIAQLNLGSLEEEHGREAVAQTLAKACLLQYASHDLTDEKLFAMNLVQAHQLLARINRKLGQRSEGLKNLRLADETLSRLLARDPNDAQTNELRANVWVADASQAQEQGDFLGAISALEKALAVYDQLQQTWDGSTNYMLGAALTHLDIALVYQELEDHANGETHLGDAFQLFESLRDFVPQNQLAPYRADTRDTAGMYLLAAAQNAESADVMACFRDALDLLAPLLEPRPDTPQQANPWEIKAARIRAHQAQALGRTKNIPEAKAGFETAVKSLEAILNNSPSNSTKRQLAHTLWYQAELEFDNQESEAANSHFQRALDLWREVYAADPTPLHEYELARFYSLCPVPALQNPRLALKHAQGCSQSIPDNPVFSKLLSTLTAK